MFEHREGEKGKAERGKRKRERDLVNVGESTPRIFNVAALETQGRREGLQCLNTGKAGRGRRREGKEKGREIW